MNNLNLIKTIESGDTKSADFLFKKAISEKIDTALQVRRVVVAGEIYGKAVASSSK